MQKQETSNRCSFSANRWSSMNGWIFLFQYYEMSYGLNVEMHKQVRLFKFYVVFLN